MEHAADRLSALPDDVLLRVLSFVPPWDGAATAVLSRRDGDGGALTLDTTTYDDTYGSVFRRRKRKAFFLDADEALEEFVRPQRRRLGSLRALTVLANATSYDDCERFLWGRSPGKVHAKIGAVVAHPAAERLQELRVVCRIRRERGSAGGGDTPRLPGSGFYELQLAALPCARTLRFLDLTDYRVGAPPPSAAAIFPCLSAVRLRRYALSPVLAHLWLEKIFFKLTYPAYFGGGERSVFELALRHRLHLRCPTLTSLTLLVGELRRDHDADDDACVRLDAPRLRSFHYDGSLEMLSLKSPMPHIKWVDLELCCGGQSASSPLCRFISRFRHASTLKLNLYFCDIGRLVDADRKLALFPNLELLELRSKYTYQSEDSTAAMANLLSCCPALRELRLDLSMVYGHHHYHLRHEMNLQNGRDEFKNSMDKFNRASSLIASMEDCSGVPDLAGFYERDFRFLRTSLRKVEMRFKMERMDCLEVQLAKFLVENARVLEEIHIDDGNQDYCSHLNHKVKKWRDDAVLRGGRLAGKSKT
uniref:F-box domain-containing protein n=1 Tax=Oryza glumipatula TaxID=40148 RepID=A0A0E0AU24_9ORYZ